MNPSMVEKSSIAAHAAVKTRRRERLFYTGMAVAVVLTVFAGFARSYYLRTYFGSPPLMPLLHLHGLVFTSWLLLFLTQNVLVAARRTDVHRRLGMVGAGLAVLMIVVGALTAVIRAQQAFAQTGSTDPLSFLTVPVFDLLVFGGLVWAGFHFRRRPDVHKRLMLLATISILAAAISRLPFDFMRSGPVAFFGLTDLFIVACVFYDLITRGRVHRATVWGGLAIIVSQPLRLMIGGTHAWIAFAAWVVHWVA